MEFTGECIGSKNLNAKYAEKNAEGRDGSLGAHRAFLRALCVKVCASVRPVGLK
jgi:hypothetical protein